MKPQRASRSSARRAGFGFVHRNARAAGIGDIEALGIAPKTLEIVVLARAFAEDMHDEITVIEQQPFCCARFAFPM